MINNEKNTILTENKALSHKINEKTEEINKMQEINEKLKNS